MKEETFEEKMKEVEEDLNKSMSYFEVEDGQQENLVSTGHKHASGWRSIM